MNLITDKFVMATLLLSVTLLSGVYPFYRQYKTKLARNFPLAESFSCGVFLGVGFLHLLVDSIHGFIANQYRGAYAVLLVLGMLVFMFFLDQLLHYERGVQKARPLLVVLMLSLHAFFEGSALGISNELAVVYVVFFAIIIHKWAESFALSVILTGKHKLPLSLGLLCFVMFSLMTPLGVFVGTVVSKLDGHYLWLEPVCNAVAAGTFIYFGTAHTFFHIAESRRRQTFFRQFKFWLLGFVLIGVISIWL